MQVFHGSRRASAGCIVVLGSILCHVFLFLMFRLCPGFAHPCRKRISMNNLATALARGECCDVLLARHCSCAVGCYWHEKHFGLWPTQGLVDLSHAFNS